ncbi:MAG: hypothetical protein K6F99_00670, partial [Lachnospiraceae bacterium]|nr:hypothetical protein [Lachnospiraceae bacterium]
MNTYYKSKTDFINDCDDVLKFYEFDINNDVIKRPGMTGEPAATDGMETFLGNMGITVGPSEVKSWIGSFLY